MTKLSIKIVAVILITIGLLVPLSLIRGLVEERTEYRAEARENISRSWTGAQTVSGPVLTVPVRPSGDDEGKCLFVYPETLEIQASLSTETRKRGLYAVPVYSSRLEISGEFDLTAFAPADETAWADLDPDSALLALPFSDNRGIVEQPTLDWAGDARPFASGSMLALSEGVHAEVGPLDPENRTRYALSEHMAFGVAYLIAAVACVGLVAVYTTSALKGHSNGAIVTVTLGGLYGMLYAILRSEDNALLMGSLLLFFALAAVMLVTRRIDWYRLGQQFGETAVAAEPPADG